MFDPVRESWSDKSPIPPAMYFEEKANFAGILIGGIFYGIVIALFFKCMGLFLTGSLSPRTKWMLVAHTSAIFSLVTVYTAISFNILSVSHVDNREFPGADAAAPPGPLGHQFHSYSEAENIVRTLAYVLSSLLADGLLLRRFWIIYYMNPWIATMPFLAHLTSLAFGIVLIYQTSQLGKSLGNTFADLDLGCLFYLISPSFNILLTLAIVSRLIKHKRDMRKGLGNSFETGVYDDVIFVLIEPCILYTVSFLLYVIPWGSESFVGDIFFPMFVQVQVIAPLLIILAVAQGPPLLTSEDITYDSMIFLSQGDLVDPKEIVADAATGGPTDANEGTSGETEFGVEATTSETTPS